MYKAQPGADNVCWIDITQVDAAELGPDLSREAAMARLHLRNADGTLVSGAQAFTSLWTSLPRWAWLGRLLGSGIPLRMLEAGYRLFLTLRRHWRRP